MPFTFARWVLILTILIACDRRNEIKVSASCDDVEVRALSQSKDLFQNDENDAKPVSVIVERGKTKFVPLLVPYIVMIPTKPALAEKP